MIRRPVIGIVGNNYLVNDEYPVHASGQMNCVVVSEVMNCIPMILPANPNYSKLTELMDICDGFLFTGAQPNVHPEEYGHKPTEAHGKFDRDRDQVSLPLIRQCVKHGQPILGVCRGFQEFNVAMGGTLHPEIRDIPGRQNHRMPPDGTLEEKFALRHKVRLEAGGTFEGIFNSKSIMVNSLHGQGILEPGERVIIEGLAPDQTPEAIRIEGSKGFALAVQWHPEWNANKDPVSRPLFEEFSKAAYEWCGQSVKIFSN
ncbi:MAG: gamma-glutamyl-gamma-aminobutyrate hydrolase [Rhodobacteraceae bacterium]|jgi:putative glutamine amidotransferase|nr:gamma-glutamyl-gamma-aminobutyrate hydrolase [Paracoccaceae bacterium]MAT00960.1 gamma-glutamyl-gamma-aminobutyrate hydrolase [Paracoccaceae bacterium]MBL6855234.1 gamma-glutamyl-gamma-aminobutyrate hydrolase family protein [Paracoccaceae bacterium]|tara:strand:- start:62 stop:835 length:774 start_codon:yes stop_codon:yes gene_type:complete